MSTARPSAEKQVRRVLVPPPSHWVGDGFPVRSLFSYADDPQAFSPFLLLDHMGPREFRPTEQRLGVGPHPHRGFETVTLLWSGEVEHRDSAGHGGKIGPGDVQWMTAGAGVLHEELQSAEFGRRGGLLEGVQLWVNLRARDKRTPPRYQDLRSASFPVVPLAGAAGALPGAAGRARLIAGELGGRRGPARTFSPVELFDVTLAPGREASLALPEGHTALLLPRGAPVAVNGGEPGPVGALVELTRAGATFRLRSEEAAQVLVMGGEPLGEPVAGHGPFVMNTWPEIAEAIDDFSSGRMGTLEPTTGA